MKNQVLSAVLALFTAFGIGFAAEPCPISFTSVQAKLNKWNFNLPLNITTKMRNTSGKEIRGTKFLLYYFDTTEDLFLTPFEVTGVGLKVGQERSWSVSDPYPNVKTSGYLVIPEKILFEDGTSFTDAQNAAGCYGELWFKKNHPRLTKLPDVLVKEK